MGESSVSGGCTQTGSRRQLGTCAAGKSLGWIRRAWVVAAQEASHVGGASVDNSHQVRRAAITDQTRLGAIRHRSEVLEYRVEQHREAFKERLAALSVTGSVTTTAKGRGSETPTSTEVQAGADVPEWARRDSNARPLAPEASALSN